jgi:hypothetical protein
MAVLTETRERFLRAIVAQVPADRIAEAHFFTPLKQGGVESGVAVIAAWPEAADGQEADPLGEASATDSGEPVEDGSAGDEMPRAAEDDAESPADTPAPKPEIRPVIYTARYRYTLKGPDRGKWETNVVAEADAPLVTVDAVVRGVQRRAGDVDEPTRLDGEELRKLVEAWSVRA